MKTASLAFVYFAFSCLAVWQGIFRKGNKHPLHAVTEIFFLLIVMAAFVMLL